MFRFTGVIVVVFLLSAVVFFGRGASSSVPHTRKVAQQAILQDDMSAIIHLVAIGPRKGKSQYLAYARRNGISEQQVSDSMERFEQVREFIYNGESDKIDPSWSATQVRNMVMWTIRTTDDSTRRDEIIKRHEVTEDDFWRFIKKTPA